MKEDRTHQTLQKVLLASEMKAKNIQQRRKYRIMFLSRASARLFQSRENKQETETFDTESHRSLDHFFGATLNYFDFSDVSD